jgi:hypothetical protein
MPSSTKPASVQVDKIQTKVVSFGCTPSTHLVKMFNSFLTMPMHPPSTAFTSGDVWEHFAYMPTKLFPAELIDE